MCEKLAGPIYTGKREFIGFSVHNGVNAGRDYTLAHKKIFCSLFIHHVMGLCGVSVDRQAHVIGRSQ